MSKIFPNINNSDFHIIANKNDKTKIVQLPSGNLHVSYILMFIQCYCYCFVYVLY